MKAVWISGIAVAWTLAACPIPAPIDGPLDETVAPPRIVWTALDPPAGLVTVSEATASTEFRILQLEDPNVGDTLTVRFFVDYHRDTSIQREVTIAPDSLSSTPTVRVTVSFVASTALFGANPTSVPHTVEAFVSDRGFVDGGSANRSVPAEAKTAYVSWAVRVVP